tara:strand:+ start:1169 stop:1693 length:525 start_codon:yes stop_codon:yes gene_type:complete
LELINDILDLAKVESGRVELALEQFLLQDCLSQVTNVVLPFALNKTIEIKSELADGISLVTANEGRFRQILYSLFSNAIKFTPEKGQVEIKARCIDNGELQISVRDMGIGIQREHQALIFSEFRQVEESYARCYEGTGLGLALTKRLLELLGGNIWVESEEGKGSIFTLEIPGK